MTETRFKFHSAVNSIPVIRPSTLTSRNRSKLEGSNDKELSEFLSDRTPITLDHLAANTFSGELQVTIQTATALIFGEQTKHSSGPSTIDIQRDPVTNIPIISPTMIKGMIANAYERITASRFRIFGSHSSPVTYRCDPAAAVTLVPIRLSEQFSLGDKKATLLHGHNGSKYAHIITHEDIPGKKDKRALLQKPEAWEILQHGTLVYFKAKQLGDAYYVTQVKKSDKSSYVHLKTPTWIHKEPAEETEHTGWFYATQTDTQLRNGIVAKTGKKSEFIFFANGENDEQITIDDYLVRDYAQIIKSYSYDPTQPGTKIQDSYGRFEINLQDNSDPESTINTDGLLAYARIGTNGKVSELLPTQVGRRSYQMSPRSLAAEQQILPSSRLDTSSPGDRLFGFVPQDSDIERPAHTALRGRITISHINTSSIENVEDVKKPHLHPLLPPKESSARRFLTTREGHPIAGRARPKYFSPGDFLGAAVYPFSQNDLASNDGITKRAKFSTFKDESSLNDEVQEKNHNAHSQAVSWIPKGQSFSCTLRFEGLSVIELQVLLLILSSDLLGKYALPSGNHPTGYLRMGTGKSLGLGIVKVDCCPQSVYRTRAEDDGPLGLVSDYKGLCGCLGAPSEYLTEPDWRWNYESFITQADEFYKELSQTSSAKAFLRSCVGYSTEYPVRYMRLDENQWNNQTNSETGLPKSGHAVAPTSLAADNWEKPMSVGR